MRSRLPLALLAAAALAPGGLSPRPARADEANPKGGAASEAGSKDLLERAAKVRAKLPAPVEPEEGKPSLDFGFEGDLVASGENTGSVRVKVDVGTFRDQPIWLSTEEVVDDFGGSHTVTESTLYLARDLTLLKGEWSRTSPDRSVQLTFVRDGDGFEVSREITMGAITPVMSKIRLAAPAGATYGRGAQLLFLRHAGPEAASYALPLVPLDAAVPAANEHEAVPETDPLRIEVVGAAKYGTGKATRDAWLAKLSQGRRASEAYFVPKTRDLIGIDYVMPPGIRIVPKGEGGAKPVYEDDKPATTWKAAFLKFGHGYHLAVEKWIIAAIHWETMLAHEIAIGEWPKDTALADFRKAYVAEFIAKSKHRPREQADGLLRMTLATGEVVQEKDGAVVLRSSPEFGGNVYHFHEIGGVWYLTQIDQ